MYGKGNTFDVDRLIELLQAFETFVDVRDSAPIGPAATSTPRVTNPALASAGPALALPPPGTAGLATRNNRSRRGGSLRARQTSTGGVTGGVGGGGVPSLSLPGVAVETKKSGASEALVFLFGDQVCCSVLQCVAVCCSVSQCVGHV